MAKVTWDTFAKEGVDILDVDCAPAPAYSRGYIRQGKSHPCDHDIARTSFTPGWGKLSV